MFKLKIILKSGTDPLNLEGVTGLNLDVAPDFIEIHFLDQSLVLPKADIKCIFTAKLAPVEPVVPEIIPEVVPDEL